METRFRLFLNMTLDCVISITVRSLTSMIELPAHTEQCTSTLRSCIYISFKHGFDPRSTHTGYVADKVAVGMGFSPSASVFLCQYHSTRAPYFYVSFICHRPYKILAIEVGLNLNICPLIVLHCGILSFIQGDQKVSVHLTITVQKAQKYSILKSFITEYIRNVDLAILNRVFENTVRRVNKCLETGGGHFKLYL